MKRAIWTIAIIAIVSVASAALKTDNANERVVESEETTVSMINWDEEKSRPGSK